MSAHLVTKPECCCMQHFHSFLAQPCWHAVVVSDVPFSLPPCCLRLALHAMPVSLALALAMQCALQSDVWSLGCVLYEMATLRHPFDAPNMRQLATKVVPLSPLPTACFVGQCIQKGTHASPVRRQSQCSASCSFRAASLRILLVLKLRLMASSSKSSRHQTLRRQ